jgi:hypothetical protein
LRAERLEAKTRVVVAAVLVVLSIFRNEHSQPALMPPLLEQVVMAYQRLVIMVRRVEILRLIHKPH